MTKSDTKRGESIGAILSMGLWAGAGGVLLELFLVGCLCLFEPLTRAFILQHLPYLALSLVLMFVVAFGLSVGFTAGSEIRRGKGSED